VTWAEMPRSPGHAFSGKLQKLLNEAGFDIFVEEICKPFYAPKMGAPSLPPGRYFRMHMVGYFEGIDSERGIVWRCSDSFSLRDFLRLVHRDKVRPFVVIEDALAFAARGARASVWLGIEPGRRARLGEERADRRRRFDHGGQRRAAHDRASRQRRDLSPDADAHGAGERRRHAFDRRSRRLDRKRKGKTLSNADWTSKTDPDAKIARMKDGTTHLAYKPEHAVDRTRPVRAALTE
jgi:Transposase domain (DUF772)